MNVALRHVWALIAVALYVAGWSSLSLAHGDWLGTVWPWGPYYVSHAGRWCLIAFVVAYARAVVLFGDRIRGIV